MLKRFALAALLAPALAFGHEEPRHDVRVLLDGVKPVAPQLIVQVYDDHLAPQLVVENKSGTLLEILDEHGRAFVRVGPGGVEGDFSTRAWYRTLSPGGAAMPAALKKGDGAPQWRRVRAEPSWGWFDPRLEKESLEIPKGVAYAGTPFTLRQWQVPARLDRKPLAIEGHFEFQPAPAGVWRARLTSPAEPLPEVRVTLSQGTPPALLLDNAGAAPVTVLGAHGEPFLRIGPRGVEVNLASATWQDQNRYRGLAAELAPPAPERWQRVSTAPRYAWLEPRIRADAAGTPWRVPLESGGRKSEITGVLEWTPAKK